MTQFVDADSRKWEIEVSVPAIKRFASGSTGSNSST